MSTTSDEPPPDAVELLVMANLLGIVKAITPIDVAPMVAAPVPVPMILLPTWWDPRTAPLFEQLASGRLVAWGRLGSLLGPWTRLPDDERVWRSVEVDWDRSELTLVRECKDWTLTVGGGSFRYGKTADRATVATLHNCRVAWAAQVAPVKHKPSREIDDSAELAEMHMRVAAGESSWAAAGDLARHAAGAGTVASKQQRLHSKFTRGLSQLRTE